ncbi:alcohol dehydrogenase catalytic domain-containing protein [Geodermatophilus obscurus]|uniref:Alcohol dehydrogenase GroES domain protein n=2 Tax=Geodermatophilus obscurus TaxID=1861 RepID=D2SC12_GEOOG|nr:alcohol dehydrogenase catalytic domain-containing protein [Geodermatophilus obscurus]ADB74180.1 Alcohol dehydrogenase GroES domain protein [Geodermatophilus obscurus DSM 43160]
MKAVVKHAAERGIKVREDWAEPVAGPGQVLLEVAAASLCGTDRELYEWTPSAQAFNLTPPVVLGHEGSGTVLAVGAGVENVTPGDRVALESHLICGRCYPCRTGSAHTCERTGILGMHIDGVFAERVAVPAGICVPLPESVSLETGALLESAGVAMHAVQRSGYAVAGQYVLVNGCGPVGLVIAQIALALGAAAVVAVEPNQFRRKQAESIGARVLAPSDDVVGVCRDLAGRRGGFDVAFEVSGVRGVLPPLLEALRREATLVTVGHPSEPAAIDIAAFVNKKGVTLRGIFGRRLWDTWEQLLLLLQSGRIDLDWLITHRLSLDEAEVAVELLTGDAGKVLLVPGVNRR